MQADAQAVDYQCGEFTISPATRRVLCNGVRVELEAKVFDLILLLLENRQRALDKQEIVTALWGKRPVTDAALSQLLYKARRVFDDDGEHQTIIRTVYGRGLQWIAPVEALPPAHEETIAAAPAAANAAAPAQRRMRMRIAWTGVIVLVLLAVATGAWYRRHGAAPAVPGKSIAVLPFVNESGDKNEQYFSDGLSEDLINALSQFAGLKVISRDSSFQFRGSKDSAAQIGRALDVAHLLEGSVRRNGDEVRITATLVNTADGSNLWSQHYDRPYKDLFKLQDDITSAVTAALKTRLLASDEAAKQTGRPPSGNLAAYNAVLQGNFYLRRDTLTDTQTAARQYEKATQLDPDYAYAWASLAGSRNTLVNSFPSGDERAKLERGARIAANKALALAPDLAEAHLAQAGILQDFDWNIAGAERELQRAAQLAPQNSSVLLNLATVQGYRGHFDDAVAMQKRAIALDPLSANAEANLGALLASAGDLPAAQQAYQKAIALQPQATGYHASLVIVQLLQGNPAAALATAKQETGPFWRTYALALAYWANGERAKSDAALKQLIDKYADVAGSQIAEVYAQRGQPDQAFQWLEHAVATRDGGVLEMLINPFLARYRNRPRYLALARNLGLIGSAATLPATRAAPVTAPASAASAR